MESIQLDFLKSLPPIHIPTFHKPDCKRYCKRQAICLTCHETIQCKQLTSCEMCGGYYGRPLHQPMSVGCLLIDCNNQTPVIWLICEVNKKTNVFEYNDIGGKVDADLDTDHIDAVMREIREESGYDIIINDTDPYVDIYSKNTIIYRCYIKVLNLPISILSIPSTVITRMPLLLFLKNVNEDYIGGRVKQLFRYNNIVKNLDNKTKLKELLSSL